MNKSYIAFIIYVLFISIEIMQFLSISKNYVAFFIYVLFIWIGNMLPFVYVSFIQIGTMLPFLFTFCLF